MSAGNACDLHSASVQRICRAIVERGQVDPVTLTSLQIELAMLQAARDDLAAENRRADFAADVDEIAARARAA